MGKVEEIRIYFFSFFFCLMLVRNKWSNELLACIHVVCTVLCVFNVKVNLMKREEEEGEEGDDRT